MQKEQKITIIHFNDVYDIQPHPKGHGGICNFKREVQNQRSKYPDALLLFSGDAFSPSILTQAFRGKQMVHALNSLKIDYACYGNHQFDLRPEQTMQNVRDCNFPWLLGNITYIQTGLILGDGYSYRTFTKNGLKVGIFGVGGIDWLGILTQDYIDMLDHQDVVTFSSKICKKLRNQQKCDLIIALTHMRQPQDKELALKVDQIDIILGGHDHIISQKFINGTPVIKSGSNFMNLCVIQLVKKQYVGLFQQAQQMQKLALDKNKQLIVHSFQGRRFNYQWQMHKVPIYQDVDADLKAYVDKAMIQYKIHDRVVGYTQIDLQARFCNIRTKQSNYGNFLADLCRFYYNSDVCLLNSGCMRNDAIIPKGKLYYTTVANILNDLLVQKKMPGRVIAEALEKSCSTLPDIFSGSFLFVSGITFQYDYKKSPRVRNIKVNNSPLDLDSYYTVSMLLYLSKGGDGYTMFSQCQFTIDIPSCIQLLFLIQRFFEAPDSRQIYNSHRDALELIHRMMFSSGLLQNKIHQDQQVEMPDFPPLFLKKKTSYSAVFQRLSTLRKRFVIGSDGERLVSICPIADGRIKCITDLQDNQLNKQKKVE